MTPLTDIEDRLRAGNISGALSAADTRLGQPNLSIVERVGLLKLRARAHTMNSSLVDAIADLKEAVSLAPTDARVFNALGILCVDVGDQDNAMSAFRRAVEIDPAYAQAWNNYGSALRSAGRRESAASAFTRAVSSDPAYALAWANLGSMLREMGNDAGAEAAYNKALALGSQDSSILRNLANMRRGRGEIDAAVQLYARAAQRDPSNAVTYFELGATLTERDDLASAAECFDAALHRDPGLLRAAFARSLMLPMVPTSAMEVQDARVRFARGLGFVERELPVRAKLLSSDRILDELRWSNFLLAYQGEDDRELQARYALATQATVATAHPELLEQPSTSSKRGARIRVGFVSAFFRDGTVGRYFERWITDLPRDRFETFVYHLQPGIDPVASRIASCADVFRHCLHWPPSRISRCIRTDALDVLVFPELGMDRRTFALAGLRLARRQCVGWGHPVTTGYRSIDVFFSSAIMEPANAPAHYTERLVVLPGIGTRYAMPEIPRDANRVSFGLPQDAILYLCPQSLFKIHPDNDAIFAQILAATPKGKLVVFEGRHPALTGKFLARLNASLDALGVEARPRIHVLAKCTHLDYLRLNRVCDVMLDTVRWSGGNTSLDAIACGLPIVTLPGQYMRGRQSFGMLRLLNVEETIAIDADDYVRIAVELAADSGARRMVSRRLEQACPRLFDDPAPTPALADALSSLV